MSSSISRGVHRQRWKTATNPSTHIPSHDKTEDSELLSWLQASHLSVGHLHAAKSVAAHKENRTPVSEIICDNPRNSGSGPNVCLAINNPSSSEATSLRNRDAAAEIESASREMDALRRLVRSELECERLSGELAALRGQLRQVEAENDELRTDLSRAVERSHTAIDAAMEASQLVSGGGSGGSVSCSVRLRPLRQWPRASVRRRLRSKRSAVTSSRSCGKHVAQRRTPVIRWAASCSRPFSCSSSYYYHVNCRFSSLERASHES